MCLGETKTKVLHYNQMGAFYLGQNGKIRPVDEMS